MINDFDGWGINISALFANTTYLGYVWLILGLLLLLLEVGTPGLFFFLSLSVGALAASITAFLGLGIHFECLIAIVVSLITLFILKKYAKVAVTTTHKTNVDALINQEALVIETIEPRKAGRVKIKGEEWPALSQPGFIHHKGSIVFVVGVEGNKLIIK
jgi:membrane protein implicated in regulation of membrane protease activity